MSVLGEFLAKLLIVLNDAVVDYGHLAATIGMGMSIELRDTAMGRPASVSDGNVAGQCCQAMLLNDFVNLPASFSINSLPSDREAIPAES